MKEFDAVKEKDKVVKFIRDYYEKYNLGGAVLGISGGKDSAVVAALMVEALGKDNVVGLTLPCHSREEDSKLAKKLSDYYGFKLLNIDLTKVYDAFKDEINKLGDFTSEELKNSDINVKPRLRMLSCYYMAPLLSAITGKPYLVVGTSNKCELFVGYFTKGGDSVHDIAPIADFTVSEVIKIGEVLNVPRELLYKTPDDGLAGMSDEEKLGVKYSEIADYIDNPDNVQEPSKTRISKLHDSSLHKFNTPTYRK